MLTIRNNNRHKNKERYLHKGITDYINIRAEYSSEKFREESNYYWDIVSDKTPKTERKEWCLDFMRLSKKQRIGLEAAFSIISDMAHSIGVPDGEFKRVNLACETLRDMLNSDTKRNDRERSEAALCQKRNYQRKY